MTDVEDFLEHFGVKGMHWGVSRRSNKRMSTEAKRAKQVKDKAKKHGRGSLTNKELGDYNKRINLEQQYKKLQPPSKFKSGHSFVKETMAVIGTVTAAYALSQKTQQGRDLSKRVEKMLEEKWQKMQEKGLGL
jgi:hypothetical protein